MPQVVTAVQWRNQVGPGAWTPMPIVPSGGGPGFAFDVQWDVPSITRPVMSAVYHLTGKNVASAGAGWSVEVTQPLGAPDGPLAVPIADFDISGNANSGEIINVNSVGFNGIGSGTMLMFTGNRIDTLTYTFDPLPPPSGGFPAGRPHKPFFRDPGRPPWNRPRVLFNHQPFITPPPCTSHWLLYLSGIGNGVDVSAAAFGAPTEFTFSDTPANVHQGQTQPVVDLGGVEAGKFMFIKLRREGGNALDTCTDSETAVNVELLYDEQ